MRTEIQDNEREKELIKLFKLDQPKNRSRIGVDGNLTVGDVVIPFEIKSTTMNDVTTARDVGLAHIRKWKTRHWLIGIYNKKAELQYIVYATPKHMEKWIKYIEDDIKRGLKISKMIVERIDYDMLYAIFGNKEVYSYEEAKFVFKRLFSKKQYIKLQDKPDGYSKETMLKMFRAHNWHYLKRGASLNNPKIPRREYKDLVKITENHDIMLKKLVEEYLHEHE
jgi:hypothetical protein